MVGLGGGDEVDDDDIAIVEDDGAGLVEDDGRRALQLGAELTLTGQWCSGRRLCFTILLTFVRLLPLHGPCNASSR